MELFGQIEAKTVTENGVTMPVFVFNTEQFERANAILRDWYLSPLFINIPFLFSLPIKIQGIENAGFLRVEWVFEDVDPEHAYELYLSKDLADHLAEINRDAQSFGIALEGKDGLFGKRRTEFILEKYSPYILDWSGASGVLFYLRNSMKPDAVKPAARNIVPALAEGLETGKITFATGLYTELGYQYRILEEWERAINCYRKEIQLGLGSKQKLSYGCMKALCNLGVIYKKQMNYVNARKCFLLALHLNPNYFEVLISLAGITEDLDLSKHCLGRCHRIQPQNPYVSMAIENLCASIRVSPDKVRQEIAELAPKIDLFQPIPKLTISDPKVYLRDLGFL